MGPDCTKMGSTPTTSKVVIQTYVAGFLFNEDRSRVALVRKNRPEWQAGLLNAIGGKVEVSDETYKAAMIREFQEETGLLIESWLHFCTLSGTSWKVYFYSAISDKFKNIKTATDEQIIVTSIDYFYRRLDLMKNLKVLLSLALDTSGIETPVYLNDFS